MDIDLILFALFSILVLVDYSWGGYQAWLAARESKVAGNGKRTGPFAVGVGYLMFTVAVFQFLWLMVIFGIFKSELSRHVITAVFCSIDIVAVIARRRWWKDATGLRLNGRKDV